ncbi:MAG: chemotaxis response regulator protein-glutamate methylesterase [Ruminiclostridium sp.]
MPKIRVLVCDDSLLFRETIARALNEDKDIEVIGTACNAYEARDKIVQLRPDVVTLDVEMPKMSGIEFLKKLIPQYPIPVIVCSSSPVTSFDAISAGAVDYIKKPVAHSSASVQVFASHLCNKVKIAAVAKVKVPKSSQIKPISPLNIKSAVPSNKIIALGASTGGTDALQVVLQNLPANTPGIVVVQHMPAGFTKMYAERMDRVCKMSVKEAENGDRVETGKIIIAAGGFHLRLCKDMRGYYVSSTLGDKVSGHCPSVDVLFDSVAETAGANAVGAILTGMGSDGAKGLLKMKKAGAFTIGQDKESCVVYGMPMVAYNIGAVTKQAPLQNIGELILENL